MAGLDEFFVVFIYIVVVDLPRNQLSSKNIATGQKTIFLRTETSPISFFNPLKSNKKQIKTLNLNSLSIQQVINV